MLQNMIRPLPLVLGVSLLLNLATWLLAIFVFPQAGPATVLHYTAPLGVDFIGESRQIYVLPLIGLVMLAGNAALGALIHRPAVRAAWVLWATLPPIQIILLVATTLLWQFNR